MNLGQITEALAAATDEEPSEATKKRFLKLWGEITPLGATSPDGSHDRSNQGA